MSIFTMDETLWGTIPISLQVNKTKREQAFPNTLLANYYSFSAQEQEDTIIPLLTGYNNAIIKVKQSRFAFTLPGFDDVNITLDNAPRFYTAETVGTTVFGFGTTDKIYAYCAFANGKKADIIAVDEKILIIRFLYDDVDEAYIYSSNISSGVQLTEDLGGAVNRGYCDKYLLTPMAYRGIIANNAFLADGGMSELSEGICKIDSSHFYRIAKNIVVKVDELIK